MNRKISRWFKFGFPCLRKGKEATPPPKTSSREERSKKIGAKEALWNIFDFVIVSISVAETVVDYAAQSLSATADGSGSFRVMRALRLARTLRGVRIIRLFRYFSETWLNSMRSRYIWV